MKIKIVLFNLMLCAGSNLVASGEPRHADTAEISALDESLVYTINRNIRGLVELADRFLPESMSRFPMHSKPIPDSFFVATGLPKPGKAVIATDEFIKSIKSPGYKIKDPKIRDILVTCGLLLPECDAVSQRVRGLYVRGMLMWPGEKTASNKICHKED